MLPIVTDRVPWSVGLSVYHTSNPCRNGWTDRDAVWVVGLHETKESYVIWGPRSQWEWVILSGKGQPVVTYTDTLPWCVQKRRNGSRFEIPFGLWTLVGTRKHY